jgi:hypothetical protein
VLAPCYPNPQVCGQRQGRTAAAAWVLRAAAWWGLESGQFPYKRSTHKRIVNAIGPGRHARQVPDDTIQMSGTRPPQTPRRRAPEGALWSMRGIIGARASYPSSATGTSATTRPSHSTRTDVGILRGCPRIRPRPRQPRPPRRAFPHRLRHRRVSSCRHPTSMRGCVLCAHGVLTVAEPVLLEDLLICS